MTKKNWIGQYGYTFEENTQYFQFEINADYNNGSFEGSVYEEGFSNRTSDKAHVKGFIESEIISFIKTYPYFFAVDEEGNVVIDKSLKGHTVVYEGYFNEENGTWSGQWEILISEKEVVPGVFEESSVVGPWEMKLKESL